MGGAIVLIPLESHAEDVTVTVTVQSTISLSLSGTPSATDVLPNSKVEGTDSSFYTLASVTTNSTAGYTLTVIDKDTDNSLKAGSHSIPATASNSLTAGTAAWGYREWWYGLVGDAEEWWDSGRYSLFKYLFSFSTEYYDSVWGSHRCWSSSWLLYWRNYIHCDC